MLQSAETFSASIKGSERCNGSGCEIEIKYDFVNNSSKPEIVADLTKFKLEDFPEGDATVLFQYPKLENEEYRKLFVANCLREIGKIEEQTKDSNSASFRELVDKIEAANTDEPKVQSLAQEYTNRYNESKTTSQQEIVKSCEYQFQQIVRDKNLVTDARIRGIVDGGAVGIKLVLGNVVSLCLDSGVAAVEFCREIDDIKGNLQELANLFNEAEQSLTGLDNKIKDMNKAIETWSRDQTPGNLTKMSKKFKELDTAIARTRLVTKSKLNAKLEELKASTRSMDAASVDKLGLELDKYEDWINRLDGLIESAELIIHSTSKKLADNLNQINEDSTVGEKFVTFWNEKMAPGRWRSTKSKMSTVVASGLNQAGQSEAEIVKEEQKCE